MLSLRVDRETKKGVFWFLAITFASTYLVEIILFLRGVSFIGVPPIEAQLTVAGVMFFPGLASIIVRKFITHDSFKDAGLKIGKLRNYINVYLLMPFLFFVIYLITWVFVKSPDFSLQTFLNTYGITGLPASPAIIITAIFVSTVTFAPFLNAIPAFGEELGWRGYLLPKLMPLGVKKALVISGIVWGLWHAPLVLMGYKYGTYGVYGIIFFTILVMLLGIYMGYIRLVSGSVIAAAFAHGVFNAQAFGMWTLLFPDINPLLGGYTGWPGILVFSILAYWVCSRLDSDKSVSAKSRI